MRCIDFRIKRSFHVCFNSLHFIPCKYFHFGVCVCASSLLQHSSVFTIYIRQLLPHSSIFIFLDCTILLFFSLLFRFVSSNSYGNRYVKRIQFIRCQWTELNEYPKQMQLIILLSFAYLWMLNFWSTRSVFPIYLLEIYWMR